MRLETRRCAHREGKQAARPRDVRDEKHEADDAEREMVCSGYNIFDTCAIPPPAEARISQSWGRYRYSPSRHRVPLPLLLIVFTFTLTSPSSHVPLAPCSPRPSRSLPPSSLSPPSPLLRPSFSSSLRPPSVLPPSSLRPPSVLPPSSLSPPPSSLLLLPPASPSPSFLPPSSPLPSSSLLPLHPSFLPAALLLPPTSFFFADLDYAAGTPQAHDRMGAFGKLRSERRWRWCADGGRRWSICRGRCGRGGVRAPGISLLGPVAEESRRLRLRGRADTERGPGWCLDALVTGRRCGETVRRRMRLETDGDGDRCRVVLRVLFDEDDTAARGALARVGDGAGDARSDSAVQRGAAADSRDTSKNRRMLLAQGNEGLLETVDSVCVSGQAVRALPMCHRARMQMRGTSMA
ncbi:hypothetical protein DFH06DRAFT_1188309 [Mycena polygramma]|nr:hypothetical protein DFH06DRAFT_1188309 [Mycena polygramma]